MPDLSLPINFIGLGIGAVIMLVVGLAIIMFMTRSSGGRGKWSIKVTIYESRANNIVEDYDFGRRVEDTSKGVTIELKNRKKKIPPIPLNYLSMNKKGKSTLRLYTPDNERFYPVKFDFSDDTQPTFLEEKEWDIVDYRTSVKLRELFHTPSFLEKWGNILYMLIFGFVLMLVIYMVLGKLSEIATITSSAVSIASDNLKASKELSQAMLQIAGSKGLNISQPVQPPY